MRVYAKTHKTPTELVELLAKKGLSFADRSFAEKSIERIGFERLRIYLLSRRSTKIQDKPFYINTSFEDIIEIYNLDEELRSIAFKGCSQFELHFRNALSDVLTSQYGPHPFLENIYHNPASKNEAIDMLSYVFFKRLNQDDRAEHYFDTYDSPSIPPMWQMKEFFTFEKSVTMFNYLEDGLKTAISKRMGINISNHSVFSSWIKSINDLRNACAHHDRIFNKKFQKQPQHFSKSSIPTKGKEAKLGGLLQCIDFCLKSNGSKIIYYDEAKYAVLNCKQVSFIECGFE